MHQYVFDINDMYLLLRSVAMLDLHTHGSSAAVTAIRQTTIDSR